MKKLFLSITTFLGLSFGASATPVQANEDSSYPTMETQVINLETITVDKYGTFDLGLNISLDAADYQLLAEDKCNSGNCGNCDCCC